MARNKGTDTIESAETTAVEFGGFTIQPGTIEPPKREEKYNPLEDAVLQSLDGPLSVPVNDEKQAAEVKNYVRRAATKNDLGLQMQYRDGAVHFRATREKRQRKYTTEEIRSWALDSGYGDYSGVKVPQEVRDAFKVANGFAKPAEN